MKQQTISRKNLAILYKSVCSGWQAKINDVLKEQQFNDEIDAPEELILQAYKEADDKQKKLLEKYFNINLPKSISSRIKSFDDILDILGLEEEDVLPWKNPKNKNKKSQNALAKIQCITEVYNEGTILDWANHSQYKWAPYFRKGSPGGWAFDYVCSWTDLAHLPSGCYYKSREGAEDAIKKFMDIYIDYLPS